jgi:hypothetical protein
MTTFPNAAVMPRFMDDAPTARIELPTSAPRAPFGYVGRRRSTRSTRAFFAAVRRG